MSETPRRVRVRNAEGVDEDIDALGVVVDEDRGHVVIELSDGSMHVEHDHFVGFIDELD
jgi:hypothetical protein